MSTTVLCVRKQNVQPSPTPQAQSSEDEFEQVQTNDQRFHQHVIIKC